MTSEVLIANSNSLVLSSDGAVTVRGKKTFTGVKKMLKLCSDPSMVVMFYGKPDFGLVDIESAIEEFKKQIMFDDLNNIKDVSSKFIEFLKEYTYSDDVESFVKYNLGMFKRDLRKNIENMDEKLFWDYVISEKNLMFYLSLVIYHLTILFLMKFIMMIMQMKKY